MPGRLASMLLLRVPLRKGAPLQPVCGFLVFDRSFQCFSPLASFFSRFSAVSRPIYRIRQTGLSFDVFLHPKPRTPRNHWKMRFGRVAKATYGGIFPCLPWATGRWRPGGAASRRIGHTSGVDRADIERSTHHVKDYYRKKGNIFEGRPAGSPLPQTPPPPVIPPARHSDRSRPKGGVVESGRYCAAAAGPCLGPASVAGRISPLRLRSGQAATLRSK